MGEYKKEIKRLNNIASSLDRERDELQQEVDEKAEKLVRLDDGLRQQQQVDTELKLNLEELQENLRLAELRSLFINIYCVFSSPHFFKRMKCYLRR